MTELPFVNWGTSPIDLWNEGPIEQIVSTGVHFKEDGARDNTPSLAFVCESPSGAKYVHQMSIQTLEGVLRQAGYRTTRLKSTRVEISAGSNHDL